MRLEDVAHLADEPGEMNNLKFNSTAEWEECRITHRIVILFFPVSFPPSCRSLFAFNPLITAHVPEDRSGSQLSVRRLYNEGKHAVVEPHPEEPSEKLGGRTGTVAVPKIPDHPLLVRLQIMNFFRSGHASWTF